MKYSIVTTDPSLPTTLDNIRIFDEEGYLLTDFLIQNLVLAYLPDEEKWIPTLTWTFQDTVSLTTETVTLERLDVEISNDTWYLYSFYDPDRDLYKLDLLYRKGLPLAFNTLSIVIGLENATLELDSFF